MTANIPQQMQRCLTALKAHGFAARYAKTVDEANAIVLDLAPQTSTIGIGDSVTLRQTGIIDKLSQRGNPMINPFTRELTQTPVKRDLFVDLCRKTLTADVFLTSVNAVTEDGKLMSIDYAGNRVAGMIFGAPRIILLVGRNKITCDIEAAHERVKNVITPVHAQNKGRKTPCTATGRCSDCESPGRICGVTVILERKLAHFEYSVILIDEDLGLGWDPGWDEKRIAGIKNNYWQSSWSFAFKDK